MRKIKMSATEITTAPATDLQDEELTMTLAYMDKVHTGKGKDII
jgi:hypothetical protein